jgi:hypothetical protein
MSGDRGWIKARGGGWVPAGRWIKTHDGERVRWVPVPEAPPPLPPPSLYSDLDGEFLRNPLEFMRKHSVSPPHQSGQTGLSEFGTVAATTVARGSNFKVEKEFEIPDQPVERRTGAGGIRHMQLIKHPDPNFPGATSLRFAPAGEEIVNGTRSIPIYWLPWKDLKILQCKIPEVPRSLAGWDDEAYPRFFFTAGINGCSVFVHGDSRSPTVSHAGLENPLTRPAGEFWLKQMDKTRSGFYGSEIRGAIHRHDYMFKGSGESKLATDYLQWLSMPGGNFKLEITSPFGCVFGMRFGRLWSFYLQKSVVVTTVRFYKKPEVYKEQRPNTAIRPIFDVKARDTGLLATREPSQYSLNWWGPIPSLSLNWLGPMPYPSPSWTEVKIFSTSEAHSRPLEVSELFPNRRTDGNLNGFVRRTF